jgi:O-antigen/teichoic acid export membrane protein
MAPTFEALVVPAAYRGDYARLSFALAPGFFAFCAIYSMCSPVFQLAGKTWPLTLAALSAFAANLSLTRLTPFSADVDGLAKAYAASLVVGLATASMLALRVRAIRPSVRDVAVIAAATAAMAYAIRPMNAIHPPLLAAVLAVVTGGCVLAVAMLAFDVGGCRGYVLRRPRPADVLAVVRRHG